MKTVFGALATLLLLLQITNVNAADRVKPAKAEHGVTGVKNDLQGGVTIPGSTRVFRPLPPEEVEKLGRQGVTREMMRQQR
jgi:hypothetical protein